MPKTPPQPFFRLRMGKNVVTRVGKPSYTSGADTYRVESKLLTEPCNKESCHSVCHISFIDDSDYQKLLYDYRTILLFIKMFKITSTCLMTIVTTKIYTCLISKPSMLIELTSTTTIMDV